MTNLPPFQNPGGSTWPYGYWQPMVIGANAQNTTNFRIEINNVITQTFRLVVWVHRSCAKKNGVTAVWRHTKGKQACYYCQKPMRGRKCGHPDTVEEGSPCSYYPDPPVKAVA